GGRGSPPGSLYCDAHSWWGKARRFQDAADDVCRAEIRLAGGAALGHRRKRLAAWKRDSFLRTNSMGALPMAADKHLRSFATAVGNDYVAAGGAIGGAGPRRDPAASR